VLAPLAALLIHGESPSASGSLDARGRSLADPSAAARPSVSSGPPVSGGPPSRGAASSDEASLAGRTQMASAQVVSLVSDALGEINSNLDLSTRLRIAAAIDRYSREYDLDPALVLALIRVESSGRTWVRSSKGAVGLMQVMPYMMDPMGLAGNAATIESNIQAGCAILADNIRRLGEEDGISSYFWGARIRDVAYFEKVSAARDDLRGL
jgi:soluble lytic murein transglycosylase-like protein